MELNDNKECFVCGKDNEHGLKIDFSIKDKKIKANFSIDKRFEGFPNIIHGGIISTILDEAMVKLAFKLGLNAVTASLNVKLRKPVKPDEKMIVTGKIVEEFERKLKAKAEIRNEDGDLIAEAESILVKCQKSKIYKKSLDFL